jgi:hypothetical protein
MKRAYIMRNLALALSFLLLTLVSSVLADVILKDGKVVKVGRDAVVTPAGKIRIQDCTTGETSEYAGSSYELRKGKDCRTSPSKKMPPLDTRDKPMDPK